MNSYSIELTQTVTNPELLVDGSINPLEIHGGIMIQIDGGPTSGSPLAEVQVTINKDLNGIVSLADKIYPTAQTLPNIGRMTGEDRMKNIYNTVKNEIGTIPKAIVATNLEKVQNDGYKKYIIVPGEFSRVDIAYPESPYWNNFILFPNTVYRWYKKRICWSPEYGGYYYWYFETISTLPTCPATNILY